MNNLFPYIIVGAGVVFFLAHFLPIFLASKTKGSLAPDISDLTGTAPTADTMLYYFWSPSCGMCKGMTPIIEELATERNDIQLVDVSVQPEIARRFGTMGTPSMVVVNEGKIAKVLLGAKTRKKIESLLP